MPTPLSAVVDGTRWHRVRVGFFEENVLEQGAALGKIRNATPTAEESSSGLGGQVPRVKEISSEHWRGGYDLQRGHAKAPVIKASRPAAFCSNKTSPFSWLSAQRSRAL